MALNLDRRSGSEALRRFLARPPAPRMIFGGPEAAAAAAAPPPPRLVRRAARRVRRALYALCLMRPPEALLGFAMVPFD